MKTNRLLIPLSVAVLAIASLSASADTISVANNGMYSIDDGTPNNGSDNLAYLNKSISLWNAATPSAIDAVGNNDFSKLASSVPSSLPTFSGSYTKFDSVTNPLNFDLGTTPVNYLLVHYGGYSISYYLGGLTGVIDIQDHPLDTQGGGISSVAEFFGSTPPPNVPDGGMTMALLGLGLVSIGSLSRMVRK